MKINIEDANIIANNHNTLYIEDVKLRSYLLGFISGRVSPDISYEMNIENNVILGFTVYISDKSDSLTIYLDNNSKDVINKMYQNIEKVKTELNQKCIEIYKKYDNTFEFDEKMEYNFELNSNTFEFNITYPK